MAKLRKASDVKQYSNSYTGNTINPSVGVGGMNTDIPPIDNFGGQLSDFGGNEGNPNFSFNSQSLSSGKNRPQPVASSSASAKKVVKKR